MDKVRVLKSAPERLRGLLFTKPRDELVVLAGCSDVHTFGMGYAIDVAFVNHEGVVLKSYRSVEPRSRICCSGAAATVERASQAHKSWYVPGQFAGESVRNALKVRRPR